MTNEELEDSLRTEVDNYFKSAFADVRQEVEKLHESLESEFERHRSQIEEHFRELLSRDIQEVKIDDSFNRTVAEHIRVAREEGANDAANKFAALEPPAPVVEPPNYTALRDAVNDISSQASQAEILKALVRHAGGFAPRGALFIVKSDHLIGWKVFGDEAGSAEDAVREVFLPLANDSILSAAIKNQTVETDSGQSSHTDDRQFLEKLNFGSAQNAVAIPLIVRGRGVASLYADDGAQGNTVYPEALEMLVRTASITVELLANAKTPMSPRAASSFTAPPSTPQPTQPLRQPESSFVSASPTIETAAPSGGRNGNYNYAVPVASEPEVETNQSLPAETDYQETYENLTQIPAPSIAPSVNEAPAPEEVEPVQYVPVEPTNDFASSYQSYQPEIVEEPQPQVVEAAPQPAPQTPRFGDRNVELPINVPEEERRLHNDARRFARLLVSEIKLYNEQKVKEGRQAGDLYDRLREAVDRSREMYDKRVSPQVAGKFDYFHYELVNTLAEGDETKLGADYPGAAI